MPIRLPNVSTTVPQQPALSAPTIGQNPDGTGAAMAGQAAATMTSVGVRLHALGQQAIEDANRARAKEGIKLANQRITDILQDPKKGYLNQVGKSAHERYQETTEALERAVQGFDDAFDNAEQKKLFDDAIAADLMRARTAASIHWAKQSRVYLAGESEGRFKQHAQAVADGDEDAVQDLKDEIGVYADTVGLGPDARDELLQRELGGARADYVGALIDEGDLVGAAEQLGAHADEMRREVAASLRKQLQNAQEAAKASTDARVLREQANDLVFQGLDKFSEGSATDRRIDVLNWLQERRRDKESPISDELYRLARSAALDEFRDEQAQEAQQTAEAVQVLQNYAGASLAERNKFLDENEAAVRALNMTEEGREALAEFGTAHGKREAHARFLDIERMVEADRTMFLDQYGDELGFARLQRDIANMPKEQADKVRGWYDAIVKQDPLAQDRLKTDQRVKGALEGIPDNSWAMIEGPDGRQKLDPLVVDAFVREINAARAKNNGQLTADEEQRILDGLLLDSAWTLDGVRVPRLALSIATRPRFSELQRETPYGTLRAGDIPHEVGLALRKAMGLDAGRGGRIPDYVQRQAEDLWMKLGQPKTPAGVYQALNNPLRRTDQPAPRIRRSRLLQLVDPDAAQVFRQFVDKDSNKVTGTEQEMADAIRAHIRDALVEPGVMSPEDGERYFDRLYEQVKALREAPARATGNIDFSGMRGFRSGGLGN